MKTYFYKIDSFSLNEKKIKSAAEIIKKGGLVAFPTETVYGLGANALNKRAVKKIFLAKGRPQDNPLIVHIADKKNLRKYALEIPKYAIKLINHFWPGPLTLVFKKSNLIPREVTCGLDSVAIRIPSNKIALNLIKEAGVPIAAPSANISGKPSPTNANHVLEDLNGKINLILDGGDTDKGLESTVLSVIQKKPVLLRAGIISVEDIERIIGKIKIHKGAINKLDSKEFALSPGMKHKHYSPNSKIFLFLDNKKIQNFVYRYQKNKKKVFIIKSRDYTKEELSKNLFNFFRIADKNNFDFIFIESVDKKGIGLAIMNRIQRAASKIIY